MTEVYDILLTGAGTIGREILLRLLRSTPHRVVLLWRDRGADRVEERARRLFDDLDLTREEISRLTLRCGDVTRDGLGLSPSIQLKLAERLDAIIHTAAETSLVAERSRCGEINRTGTANALMFAGRCFTTGALKRFIHLSSAFVAGRCAPAFVKEDGLQPAPVHFNDYEWSKYEAERIVRAAMHAGLPATIFRPGMIITNRDAGARSHEVNALYLLRKLLASGDLSHLPADPEASVHFVPVAVVARAIVRSMETQWTTGLTFHLSALRPPTVAEFLDSEWLLAGGAARPRLCAPPEFERSDLPSCEPMKMAAACSPYLGLRDVFDTTNARRLVTLPDMYGADLLFPEPTVAPADAISQAAA